MRDAQADPAMYARVFEGHAEGVQILEDLVARFYDVNVWSASQRETDRRAARREVVQFILHRIGQVQHPPQIEESEPEVLLLDHNLDTDYTGEDVLGLIDREKIKVIGISSEHQNYIEK